MTDSDLKNNIPSGINQRQYLRLILKSIIAILIMGALIFFIAGRLDYIQGWVLLVVGFLIVTASIYTFRNRKDLVKERRKPGPGVKKWDKIILVVYQILLYGQLITAVLDSGRFGWSPVFSAPVYILASGVLVFSAALTFWAMKANDYFSSTVRIQSDRNHQVVTSGPYQFVRHPGYTGIIFMIPGFSLVLGSLWALVPAGMIIILFVIRTRLEDDTLKKELPGYYDYAKKVHFRLIPGIW